MFISATSNCRCRNHDLRGNSGADQAKHGFRTHARCTRENNSLNSTTKRIERSRRGVVLVRNKHLGSQSERGTEAAALAVLSGDVEAKSEAIGSQARSIG